MRFFKYSAVALLAAGSVFACAAENDSDDGAGGASSGTGGATSGSGGAPGASGGAPGASGGAPGASGGAPGASGGSTGATKTPCAAGTTVATATPAVKTWEKQTGASNEEDSTSTAAGPVSITIAAGSSDPYIAAVLSSWAESGRECIDVSAFTGVQFDLSSDADDIIFKVGISATDPAGHCSDSDAAAGNCYSHPAVFGVTTGTGVQVPFSTLETAGWGVKAPFDAKQVVSLVWTTEDKTAGKTITVSNVSFY